MTQRAAVVLALQKLATKLGYTLEEHHSGYFGSWLTLTKNVVYTGRVRNPFPDKTKDWDSWKKQEPEE